MPAGTAPVSRVQARRPVPARSRVPASITQSPTSALTTSMPPPTMRPSSTPSKTSRWSTSCEAGRMTRPPLTTTLPVLWSVRLADGWKISSPPGSTVTPATRASMSSTIRLVTTATSPRPGTPLGQVSGSLQGLAPATVAGRPVVAVELAAGWCWEWSTLVVGAAAPPPSLLASAAAAPATPTAPTAPPTTRNRRRLSRFCSGVLPSSSAIPPPRCNLSQADQVRRGAGTVRVPCVEQQPRRTGQPLKIVAAVRGQGARPGRPRRPRGWSARSGPAAGRRPSPRPRTGRGRPA